MDQMKRAQNKRAEWLSKGHGEYREIPGEKARAPIFVCDIGRWLARSAGWRDASYRRRVLRLCAFCHPHAAALSLI